MAEKKVVELVASLATTTAEKMDSTTEKKSAVRMAKQWVARWVYAAAVVKAASMDALWVV